MVTNALLVGVLGLCLLGPVPPVLTYEDRYDPFDSLAGDPVPHSNPIDMQVRAAAWREAMSLLPPGGVEHPPRTWKAPGAVRVQRVYHMSETQDLLGAYLLSHNFGRGGKMQIRENIIIFLSPEMDCHQNTVLVHEYLHALHSRLNHVTDQFRLMDPERFVQHFYPTETQDLEACPGAS